MTSRKKIIVGVSSIFAALALGSLLYIASDRYSATIQDFVYDRDAKEIHALFNRDWYWLVAASPEQYDVDFVLRYRTRSYDLSSIGSMQIKVLHDQGDFKGFVAYYKKHDPTKATILFLSVKNDARKKGYGQRLIEYAVDDLFKQGVNVVKVVTRPSNERALRLYTKLGFIETARDDDFVYLEFRKKK